MRPFRSLVSRLTHWLDKHWLDVLTAILITYVIYVITSEALYPLD